MLRRSGSTGNLLIPESGQLTLLTLRLDSSSNPQEPSKDDLSDLSLDSGVNLYFAPSPPIDTKTKNVQKMAGKGASGSDAASSCEEDYIDDVDEDLTSDKLDDFSDEDESGLNNCFVSYQFDDYPDSVFLVSEDKLELGKSRLRRSSVLNPDEVYMLKQYKDTNEEKSEKPVKRSKSIKSRF
jgi:hypothetical protein